MYSNLTVRTAWCGTLKIVSRVLLLAHQSDGGGRRDTNNVPDNAPRSQKATTAWEEKLHDIIWAQDDNSPRFRHEKWRSIFDEQIESNPLSIATSAEPLFSLPLGENVERWEIWLSKEAVWDRFNTLSQITMLKGEEKEVITCFSCLEQVPKADPICSAFTRPSWRPSMPTTWKQTKKER